MVRSWFWTIQIKGNSRILIQKQNSSSFCPKRIHIPRYEHFLFGADRAALTLGPYNSVYLTVFLISHMHYNTFTATISLFDDKETRHLHNDKILEIWLENN
jgi:hypothetical protein